MIRLHRSACILGISRDGGKEMGVTDHEGK
jgi:hypothetical protein